MSEENSSGRITYFDFLRIFATLAVVTVHSASKYWYTVDVHSYTWGALNFWDAVSRWSVPVFVMVSGALFLDETRTIDIKTLYTKNIFRILKAYIAWTVVYCIYDRFNDPESSWTDILFDDIPGYYHMWFLWMIIGLYIVVPLVRLITVNGKGAKYFLEVAFWLTFVAGTLQSAFTIIGSIGTNYFLIRLIVLLNSIWSDTSFHLTLGYVSYFVLGYYLHRVDLSRKERIFIYALSVAGFIASIFLSSSISRSVESPVETFFGDFNLNILTESAGVFVFFKYLFREHLPNISEGKKSRAHAISNYTFGMYLVHVLILEILYNQVGFSSLSFNAIVSVPVLAVIIFLISLAVSAILNHIPICRGNVV